jgi:hypothetical protein
VRGHECGIKSSVNALVAIGGGAAEQLHTGSEIKRGFASESPAPKKMGNNVQVKERDRVAACMERTRGQYVVRAVFWLLR